MTLYLRQKNEALDEDQKVLRQQLGLYKKQLALWNKTGKEQQGPGIEMLDATDYYKYKILLTNFSEAANQIIQNFGKQDFAGIGGLQKAYEILARFVKDVIEGPYLSSDKQRVLRMLDPTLAGLREINKLAAEDAFSASEKLLARTILNNIVEKNFEPIGFLPIPSEEERDIERRLRQQPFIKINDAEYKDLAKKLIALENDENIQANRDNLKDAKALVKEFHDKTKHGQITRRVFNNITQKYETIRNTEYYQDEVLPPPPKFAAPTNVIERGGDEFEELRRDLSYLFFRPETEQAAAKLVDELDRKSAAGAISRRAFNKIKKSYQDLINPSNPIFSPPFLRQRQPPPQEEEQQFFA